MLLCLISAVIVSAVELEAFPRLEHPTGVDMSKFSYDPSKAAASVNAAPSTALLDIHGTKEDYEK